jgi:hypothetical protein
MKEQSSKIHLKLLACKVLQREISLLMAKCENFIDVTYIRQDFHETPHLLNVALQEEIDKLDAGTDKYSCPEPFDAILLGYGLCSNAVTGLISTRHKIVIPKAHDCITFLLGSRESYDKNFNENPGTYWYSTGWVENAKLPSKKRLEEIRQEYIEVYGEENAPFLMEMEHNWVKDYKAAAFINWSGINSEKARQFTRECADSLQWDYKQFEGSSGFLADFLNANWNTDYFLVLEPGQTAEQSYDTGIIRAK